MTIKPACPHSYTIDGRCDVCGWHLDDLPKLEKLPAGEGRYLRFKQIVEQHQAACFEYPNDDGCLLVDPTTAKMVMLIADGLSAINRKTFLTTDLAVMVDTGWRVYEKVKAR